MSLSVCLCLALARALWLQGARKGQLLSAAEDLQGAVERDVRAFESTPAFQERGQTDIFVNKEGPVENGKSQKRRTIEEFVDSIVEEWKRQVTCVPHSPCSLTSSECPTLLLLRCAGGGLGSSSSRAFQRR